MAKSLRLCLTLCDPMDHSTPWSSVLRILQARIMEWVVIYLDGNSRWCSGKESAYQCRRCRRCGFEPWVGKIPWSSKWQPAPVFLPGKSYGQRLQAGDSRWGHKESEMFLSSHQIKSYFIYLSLTLFTFYFTVSLGSSCIYLLCQFFIQVINHTYNDCKKVLTCQC